MEIIGHTAIIEKNKGALQHFLISNLCSKVEMDFMLTKDHHLVWTHSGIIDGKKVSNSNYRDISGLLTLEDVLEILNNEIQVLVEIKQFKCNQDNLFGLFRALEILRYSDGSSIQSFNQNLIREFIRYKDELPPLEIGLIINLFKTFCYRKGNVKGLESIDFVSLSSELFEWNKVGNDYEIYRKLLPQAKQYAWAWDFLYQETSQRIENFIQKGVDGIITLEAPLVRSLVKK